MQLTLKDYQVGAVKQILTDLGYARTDWHERGRRTAFALSATTGSGKTVVAATVIEALLRGSGEFDVDADPTAVVLWVSKDPSLNEQTRSRFITCVDDIAPGDMVLLDKNYTEDSLQPGRVYFINPSKLTKSADFVKHSNSRRYTFWEILANTINDPDKTLYMVLDEAHEGMKEPSNTEQTIVQKIITGNGVNPPMPIVLGISATVKRFDEAMDKASGFTRPDNVTIDPKDVQASGLLKSTLTLDIPDEDGEYMTSMVRDATKDFVGICERWDAYCADQDIEPVLPLLVIQIPNKAAGEKDTEKGRREEDELILLLLETVRKNWPDMPEQCVAHVLGDRSTIEVGAYVVPRVAPQDIEDDHRIRVLVAKDAVSTGWDCPRAEVLVSLRPSSGDNDTYVTQLLGRMVRTPLARSTSDELLNSASCYLPYFDKAKAKIIAEEIMGIREPRSGQRGAAVGKVMRKPVMLRRNPHVDEAVVELIESLPSQSKPAATPRPIKRLLKSAQAFAQDDLVPGADKIAHETVFDVLDMVVEENASALAEEAKQIMTADIRRIRAAHGDDGATSETTSRDADAATVEDALRHLRRQLGASVVNRYLQRDMQAAIDAEYEAGEPGITDITAVRAAVAALAFIDVDVRRVVEDAADSLTRHWLISNARQIGKLPDTRQSIYEQIRGMARGVEPVDIEIKREELVDTVDTDGNALPLVGKHVLSTDAGAYPLDQKMAGTAEKAGNRWELTVLDHEIADHSLAGWYRNPSAGKHALRVAYKAGDAWKSIQPDFVFVNDVEGELRPSIIDPHGAHLGDSAPKLKALVQYADEHGGAFARIIAVGVEDEGELLALDLKDPAVRRAVYESAADSDSIKSLYDKFGSKYAMIPAHLL